MVEVRVRMAIVPFRQGGHSLASSMEVSGLLSIACMHESDYRKYRHGADYRKCRHGADYTEEV